MSRFADEVLRDLDAAITDMRIDLRDAQGSAASFDRFTRLQQGILMDLRESVEDRQTVTMTLEEEVRAGCDRLCAALVAELHAAAMRGAA